MLGPLVVKSANCLPFIGSSEVCDSVQSLQALVFLHTLTKTSLLGPFPPPKPPYPAIKTEEHRLFDVLITKLNFPLLKTIYVVYKDKPFLSIKQHCSSPKPFPSTFSMQLDWFMCQSLHHWRIQW